MEIERTPHEVLPRGRASTGHGERELVDGHAVRDRERVDPLVGRLAGEQLPQQDAVAPHVGRLRERGRLDHLRRHPRVRARRRHPRRLVRLPCQAKVRDLQRLELQVVVLDRLGNQHFSIHSYELL